MKFRTAKRFNLDTRTWDACKFEDVKRGDIYRTFEPDGTEVGAVCVALEDAKPCDPPGNWQINSEALDKLDTLRSKGCGARVTDTVSEGPMAKCLVPGSDVKINDMVIGHVDCGGNVVIHGGVFAQAEADDEIPEIEWPPGTPHGQLHIGGAVISSGLKPEDILPVPDFLRNQENLREERKHGINNCFNVAVDALRWVAKNGIPTLGQVNYNAEHLFQIADEIERSCKRSKDFFDKARKASDELFEKAGIKKERDAHEISDASDDELVTKYAQAYARAIEYASRVRWWTPDAQKSRNEEANDCRDRLLARMNDMWETISSYSELLSKAEQKAQLWEADARGAQNRWHMACNNIDQLQQRIEKAVSALNYVTADRWEERAREALQVLQQELDFPDPVGKIDTANILREYVRRVTYIEGPDMAMKETLWNEPGKGCNPFTKEEEDWLKKEIFPEVWAAESGAPKENFMNWFES